MGEAIKYLGQLRRDEPMSLHTSWRVGGCADFYFTPADLADLQHYLSDLDPDSAITWVGLGSNMLVRDGGIRGHVIAPLNGLKQIRQGDDGVIYAQSGVTCAKLAKYCQKLGLGGADFLAGIPGTVGGALAMNAGAFGSETWTFVEQVSLINRSGDLIERQAAEFTIGYRSVSQFEEEWFVAGHFRFSRKNSAQDAGIKQLLQQRNASQPIGQPSCGSVFKNPPAKHAAQLIEAAGLKGFCLGAACVSDKHANFIISGPETRATEIEALIRLIQQRVKAQFDVSLETEVRILGVES